MSVASKRPVFLGFPFRKRAKRCTDDGDTATNSPCKAEPQRGSGQGRSADRTEAAQECCRLSFGCWLLLAPAGGYEAVALEATAFFLGLRLVGRLTGILGSTAFGSMGFSVGVDGLAAFLVMTTELLVPAFWT